MSKKKKVLITIDWFVPGYKAGGPIQSCANLVAHLKKDFTFYVITRDTDYCEEKPYANVTSNKWNQLSENVQVYYFSADKLKYQNLLRVIEALQPDVSFVNGIYSFYFSVLPVFILKRLKHQHVIVSARGMLAPSAIKVKGYKKKAFLKAGQLLGLYRHVRFHATNSSEMQDIRNVMGNSTSVVIAPNLPKSAKPSANAKRHKVKNKLKLISVARISPEKNLKYALEVLERSEEAGEITFDIYGPVYNTAYWEECKQIMQRLPKNVVVNYRGSLKNDEVTGALSGSHALLMPTRGENFGHIILESFSAGCPVIISDQTPWKGLYDHQIGFDLRLDNWKAFIAAVRVLAAMEQDEFDKWSEQAYLFGQKHINNLDAIALNQLMFR